MRGELRARADEIERARRIPADLSRQLAARASSGCAYRSSTAGSSRRSADTMYTIETLAQADGSSAWCVFIAATSGTVLARLPADRARDLSRPGSADLGGVFAPRGKAVVEAGGRIPRQRPLALGLGHAERGLGDGRLRGDPRRSAELLHNGDAAPHMMIAPASEIEFFDTWHVSGLCGTGSTDYRDDRRVRARRARGRPRQCDARCELPALRLPQLHAARDGDRRGRARRRARRDRRADAARGRQEADPRQPRRSPSGPTCRARWRAPRPTCAPRARSTTRRRKPAGRRPSRAAASPSRSAATSAPPPPTPRPRVRVAQAMYECAGGTSLYRRSPLQRQLRDAHAMTQHVMVGRATWETAGRAFLGIESGTQLL